MRTTVQAIIKALIENPDKMLQANVDGELYPITSLDLDILEEHHTFDFNTELLFEGEKSDAPLIKNTDWVSELTEALELDIEEIYPHIYIDDKHLVGNNITITEKSVIISEVEEY